MSIIRERRKEMDLSRRQLAKKLDIHEQVLVRLEDNQVPTIIQAYNIYKVMGIKFQDLAKDYMKEE